MGEFSEKVLKLLQLYRRELEIIVQRAVMQAAIDDLAAQRVEIVGNELLELLFEEVGQDLGAGVVARVAELDCVSGRRNV